MSLLHRLNPTVTSLKRSGIRTITQEARTIEGCVFLTIGEPDGNMPESVKASIADALAANATHYPPNAGEEKLRQHIAAHLSRRHRRISSDQVVITNGSTEAIACALFTILAPGDEVIVPVPCFGLYDTLIRLAGGVIRELHTENDDFQITPDALRACVSDCTKAILFASPNNPTGLIYNAASLEAMKQLALERDLFILADSVYDELVYIPSLPHVMDDETIADRVILLQSFSKPYAMTGVRIGYAAAPASIAAEMIKVHAALTVGTPTFIQRGCEDIFSIDLAPMRALYQRRRDLVCAHLREMALPFPEPEGAFYVFPDIREFGLDSETFVRRLMHEEKLALIPSSCFGAEGFVRLSYCYSDEELETGLARLKRFVEKLRAER